jgi:transketolase
MSEPKATRVAFGEALLELAEEGLDIVAVGADTSKSMEVNILQAKYPKRCYDCGIAEQDLIMISAGFAATGKTVFATSYSTFLSMRSLEQLRTFVCYPDLNVKVVAGLGGFTAGTEGVTHIALEDLGIVRCIPNLIVISVADYYSTKKVIHEIAKIDKPCYVRIGRGPSPTVFDQNYKFSIGKANTIINGGNDVGIIASGLILPDAMDAARQLLAEGIGVNLIEMPTLKPIDDKSIINLAKSVKNLFTVEEHNIIGGLFSAVSEVLTKNFPAKVYPIAVPDVFTESGLPDELKAKYGIGRDEIYSHIKKIALKK